MKYLMILLVLLCSSCMDETKEYYSLDDPNLRLVDVYPNAFYEGEGWAKIYISIDQAPEPGTSVQIEYLLAYSDATSDDVLDDISRDFAASGWQTVTFRVDDTVKEIDIQIIDDANPEMVEIFRMHCNALNNAVMSDDRSVYQFEIWSNE